MTIALTGVVALVTGASGGIGREICKAMKAADAIVVASDIMQEPKDIVCDLYLQHDVTSEMGWKKVEVEIRERWGRLDSLVNNAGVSIVTRFEDTPLSEFHKLNAVNVDAIIIGIQAMLPLLKEGGRTRKGGASIVNFSSVGGLRGAAFNSAYCTSKAAIKMLSKCLGAEFAALGYNIRVNSVHPGGIDTGMLRSITERYVEIGAAPSFETAAAGIRAHHPIGRLGRPDELGGGVVYLCSEASSFVTCAEFLIDGGFSQI
ncbi:MAG: SDR family oxidoreductase [Rhodospirillaceae bacterium]|nr:MAG: SDR family oxidoreductase [Rhodospirillaceae bacterium]